MGDVFVLSDTQFLLSFFLGHHGGDSDRAVEMVLMHLFLEMLRKQFSLERVINCVRDNAKEKL